MTAYKKCSLPSSVYQCSECSTVLLVNKNKGKIVCGQLLLFPIPEVTIVYLFMYMHVQIQQA